MAVFYDYRGRAVRLTDECWAHIATHPEMSGMQTAVAGTVASPQEVVRSVSDGTVELLCRHFRDTRVGAKHLCVVVKALPDDAFVITASLTDQIKRGELLWSSGL